MRSLLAIGGSLIALLGVILALVSIFSNLASHSFFLIAGCGLVLSGALLAKQHIAGAWTYMAVFATTAGWLLHELSGGGTSALYLMIGPIIMLFMLALLMPALRRWSPARTVRVLASLITATLVVSALVDPGNGSAAKASFPAKQFAHAPMKGVQK